MKCCSQCEQANPDEALYCLRCGTKFEATAEHGPPPEVQEDEDLWRLFIGQSRTLTFSLQDGFQWVSADDYYTRQFAKFTNGASPRFALTWNWAPFLIHPFLWFLYRKMYLYAAVYFVGPALSSYLTRDLTTILVWAVIAAATGNYIYYWHIRENLDRIRQQAGPLQPVSREELKESGGSQPYVIILGILWQVLATLFFFAVLQGSPDQATLQDGRPPPGDDPRVF